MKIASIVKTTFKDSKKFANFKDSKKLQMMNQNAFYICISCITLMLISGEKMLMSAELKGCVT